MKKQHTSPQDRKYQETLGDAQFAIVVLLIAAGTLIILTLSIGLWVT